MRNLSEMTEQEITSAIFKGAGPCTPRGFSDVFSKAEILAFVEYLYGEAKAWKTNQYSQSFRDWLWSAYDRILGGAR